MVAERGQIPSETALSPTEVDGELAGRREELEKNALGGTGRRSRARAYGPSGSTRRHARPTLPAWSWPRSGRLNAGRRVRLRLALDRLADDVDPDLARVDVIALLGHECRTIRLRLGCCS